MTVCLIQTSVHLKKFNNNSEDLIPTIVFYDGIDMSIAAENLASVSGLMSLKRATLLLQKQMQKESES